MIGKWRSGCAVGARDREDVDNEPVSTESQPAGIAMPSSAIASAHVNRPVSPSPDQQRAWLDTKDYEYHHIPRSLGNPGVFNPYDQFAGSAVTKSPDEGASHNSPSVQSQGEGSSHTSATSCSEHIDDFVTPEIIKPWPSSSADQKSSWDPFAGIQHRVPVSNVLPFINSPMNEEEFARLTSQFYPSMSERSAESALPLPQGSMDHTGMTPDTDAWSQVLENMSSWDGGVTICKDTRGIEHEF